MNTNPNRTMSSKSMMLKASAILKYLLQSDEQIDTLITCKPSNVELICYDQSLYEALGSLKEYDNFNSRRLVKFIESVDIISFKKNMRQQRPVLTDERVEKLRSEALKKEN